MDVPAVQCNDAAREDCKDVPVENGLSSKDCKLKHEEQCYKTSKKKKKKTKMECNVVQRTEYTTSMDNVCKTENEEKCSTVVDSVCETVSERKCSTVTEKQCEQVMKKQCSGVDDTKCESVPERKCEWEVEEVCTTNCSFVSTDEGLKCDTCGLGFKSGKGLLDHQEEYTLCCRECGICFATTHDVNQHDLEVVHGDWS